MLDELSQTVDPNDIPTLVVYHRDGGLTDDDLAAMEADGQEIAELDGVTDEGVLTPPPPRPRRSRAHPCRRCSPRTTRWPTSTSCSTSAPNGWNEIPDAADEIRDIATLDGGEVHLAGYGGQAADSAEAFEGIDTNLIFATLGVVIVILLFTYRSPILWLLPILCAVVGQLHRHRPGLPPGEVRRPHGQRAEPGDPEHPGDRRRHRLRPAAGGPLPGGAASPRGPARGDGVRAAPRRPRDLRQRRDRRVGMLCLSFAELNSTAGLGPVARHRRRRDHARDGHAAAGTAGDLRPLGLLAQAPLLPQRRADRRRPLGRVGRTISHRPRRVWITTTGLLLLACLGLFRLDASGLSTEDTYTKEFDSIKGQKLLTEHGLSDNSNTIQVITNSDQAADVAASLEGIDGLGQPGRCARSPTAGPGSRRRSTPTSPRARPPTSSRRRREAVHGVDGADALVGGGSAFYLDTKIASERDSWVIMPLVLGVVLLILIGAAAGGPRPADPDGDRGAVLRRRARHLGAALRVRLRLRRVRSRVPVVRLRVPRGARASTTTSS